MLHSLEGSDEDKVDLNHIHLIDETDQQIPLVVQTHIEVDDEVDGIDEMVLMVDIVDEVEVDIFLQLLLAEKC